MSRLAAHLEIRSELSVNLLAVCNVYQLADLSALELPSAPVTRLLGLFSSGSN